MNESNGNMLFGARSGLAVFLLLAISAHCVCASDTKTESSRSTSVIEGTTFNGVSGITRVNTTAGDNNIQQNSTAIAVSRGFAGAGINAVQFNEKQAVKALDILSVHIQGLAFQNSRGVVMVNQSAGSRNSQFNGLATAIGGLGAAAFIQLDDASLASQATSNGYDANTQQLIKPEATISDQAFDGSRGIVQINQAAGDNNRTANSFTLSVNR